MTKNVYRDDIQILRAIAILGVLFYHYQLFNVTGGFTGVDVFFVISGYLITAQILKNPIYDISDLYNFLGKRFFRLYPAYYIMICITLVVSWVVLSPRQYVLLLNSGLFSILGISNFYYWLESGYFDSGAFEKPLLHTWSLSIEFQFYLIWVIFFKIIINYREKILLSLFALGLLAFFLCAYTMQLNQSSAFYLIFFRIWEFCLGAVIIYMPKYRRNGHIVNDVLYVMGLSLILFSFIFFDKFTSFPGYNALIPVTGAALAIYSGASSVLSARLSRNYILLFTGRVSYSLYLVHWPFITIISMYCIQYIPHFKRLVLLIISSIIGIIYFQLIENRFRKNINIVVNLRDKLFISTAVAMFCLILIFSFYPSIVIRNFNNRIVEAINSYDVNKAIIYTFKKMDELSKAENFVTSKNHLLIIGDSQAADFLNVMVAAGFDKNYEIITRKILWECGSVYYANIEKNNFNNYPLLAGREDLQSECIHQMSRLVNTPAIGSANKILIAYFWDSKRLENLLYSINEIQRRSNAQVFILGKKLFTMNSIDIVGRYGIEDYAKKNAFESKSKEAVDFNRVLDQNFGVKFIDPYPMICDDIIEKCSVVTDNYYPVMWQANHITPEAADWIARTRFDRYRHIFD